MRTLKYIAWLIFFIAILHKRDGKDTVGQQIIYKRVTREGR
jgi:hypothetical protein